MITIIGGGLAGCEAAWQIARRGGTVRILEMRPVRSTAAHSSDRLGELVCSNSMRSDDAHTAVGTLKEELRALGSLILETAEACRVPAGSALAVDRHAFADRLTARIAAAPGISLERIHVADLPSAPGIVATGPLTSPELAARLKEVCGGDALSFYDAIAPIIDGDTLTPGSTFAASRYEESEGDYLNVPLAEGEYNELMDGFVAAPTRAHLEEERNFFEGCLPVEEMARRGRDTPRFGPMKPVGLVDPSTGRQPFAVIQLRREDLAGRLYNLVGFQTQLSIPDQERILRRLPAFRDAVFVRHGSAHRNTFLDSPRVLAPDLSILNLPGVRVAGQVAGVEGYVESTACGLLAALFTLFPGLPLPPTTTVIGGLRRYITSCATRPFQPMKANWGVVDELKVRKKTEKKAALAARSRVDLAAWIASHPG